MKSLNKKFFDLEEEKMIIQAIKEAELNTSGEIRVHLEERVDIADIFQRASDVFQELEMHKTAQRNGILFYLATIEKDFAIIADEGIYHKVPKNFWSEIQELMHQRFQKREFVEGLCEGIKMTGLQMKQHFPYQSDDINELPDEISSN